MAQSPVDGELFRQLDVWALRATVYWERKKQRARGRVRESKRQIKRMRDRRRSKEERITGSRNFLRLRCEASARSTRPRGSGVRAESKDLFWCNLDGNDRCLLLCVCSRLCSSVRIALDSKLPIPREFLAGRENAKWPRADSHQSHAWMQRHLPLSTRLRDSSLYIHIYTAV